MNQLENSLDGDSSFNKKLSLWSHRRTQLTACHEALERGLEVRYVIPEENVVHAPQMWR
ncbi:MAG: hypothetical protein QW741_01980 [Sulfolobales archaeon]